MTHQLKVEVPDLPKGAEVEVPGLGVFENGSTKAVSDGKVAEYKARFGQDPPTEVGTDYGQEPSTSEPSEPSPPEPSPPVKSTTRAGVGAAKPADEDEETGE